MALTTEPLIAKSNPVEGDSTMFRKRRGTLLVVDDEDGPRQSLRVIFKDEYDILMAEDGPTAIELAKQHPIDVAVQDIRIDRKSTRLNSSHLGISYAVFCL